MNGISDNLDAICEPVPSSRSLNLRGLAKLGLFCAVYIPYMLLLVAIPVFLFLVLSAFFAALTILTYSIIFHPLFNVVPDAVDVSAKVCSLLVTGGALLYLLLYKYDKTLKRVFLGPVMMFGYLWGIPIFNDADYEQTEER
ncbi:MAG: hypothetical protein JXR97_01190 [Planctomycetes bacterium]|nr:hypothetical protein [Planctomycetota bacterium]